MKQRQTKKSLGDPGILESLCCAMQSVIVNEFSRGQSMSELIACHDGLTDEAVEFAIRAHLLGIGTP